MKRSWDELRMSRRVDKGERSLLLLSSEYICPNRGWRHRQRVRVELRILLPHTPIRIMLFLPHAQHAFQFIDTPCHGLNSAHQGRSHMQTGEQSVPFVHFLRRS